MSATRNVRILCRVSWRDEAATVTRLWRGSGPYVDDAGDVWTGSAVLASVGNLATALNGEAATLEIKLSGVRSALADATWLAFTRDEIIDSVFQLLIQPCNTQFRPQGAPEIKFNGVVDNMVFQDQAAAAEVTSTLTMTVANRFTRRRRQSGVVLSNTDQRARAAVLNPTGNPDRICERVPTLVDKTIPWPVYSS